jgi:hypothetical protein
LEAEADSSAFYEYEYSEPFLDGPAEKDPVLASELERHIAGHIGPVEEVFHEPYSDVVEIEVLRIEPTEERPYHVLMTCGMAQRAMSVPLGCADNAYAELTLALPAEWSFDDADIDGDGGWPIRLLRELARFPHENGTWLGALHTVPYGDGSETYALDTYLCGCILETPTHLPEAFRHLELSDGRSLQILQVTPLYIEELDYNLALGADTLMARFDELDFDRVVDPGRPCVVNPALPGAFGSASGPIRGTPWWRRSN